MFKETDRYKYCSLPGYNYAFDKQTGIFARWGDRKEDDPIQAPFPEILDMEISTICHGVGKPCAFCYKDNTAHGKQMSFETFKSIFDKLPKELTQIAFGIGDIFGHEDMWLMFQYAREHGVIPNITINGFGLTDTYADRLASMMGAVAVSHYQDDTCFNAIKMLTDRGMEQVNIHQVVSEESYSDCLKLLEARKTDSRLKKLHAIVFLMMKPKGRAASGTMHKILPEHYKALVEKAIHQGYPVGFDSCSAPSFLKVFEHSPDIKDMVQMSDPCESGLFSLYCNADGAVFPCSFTEGTPGWETGLSILGAEDFIKDVWNHPRLIAWKTRLLNSTATCTSCGLQKMGCRACPIYPVNVCGKNWVG